MESISPTPRLLQQPRRRAWIDLALLASNTSPWSTDLPMVTIALVQDD